MADEFTEEEKLEFEAMRTGAPASAEPPAPAPTEPPASVEPPAEPPAAEGEAVVEEEGPKPGEPGSKHRADGTFKSKEELEADATAIAEAEAEAKAPKQKQKMVPHQALHEARERERSALQRAQLLETRMNAILAAKSKEALPSTQMPDLTTSPIEYMETLKERLDRLESERQEQEQYATIDQAFTRDEETFKQIQPDYEQAGLHYLQSRYTELSNFYPPEQIQKMLMNEVRQIAIQSWDRGLPAAQTVYALAKARGYTPAAPATPTPPAPAAPAPPPAPTAEDIVKSAQNGQAQSRSLSNGSGTNTQTLNAEAVANMSDEEFDAYLKAGTKGSDDRFKALFG